MTAPSSISDAAVNTPLGAAVAIARRDLLEFVRDRRTLFVTLLLPMVTYPLVALSSALGVRTAVTDLEARAAPTPLTVAMSGADAGALAARIDRVVKAHLLSSAAAVAFAATIAERGWFTCGPFLFPHARRHIP